MWPLGWWEQEYEYSCNVSPPQLKVIEVLVEIHGLNSKMSMLLFVPVKFYTTD
jgi:hypothetical protein